MQVLQMLPLGDLASRKQYKKALPHHRLTVADASLATLEENIRSLFEESSRRHDVEVDFTESSLSQLSLLPLVEDLLHHYKLRYPKKIRRARLLLPPVHFCMLLENEATFSSFTEVSIPLTQATTLVVDALKDHELDTLLVLAVDATELTAPVSHLLQHMKRFGFERIEVSSLSHQALKDFEKECVPLYVLPAQEGTVGVWQGNAVVVPLSPTSMISSS